MNSDPIAIDFVTTRVRPRCEQLRALMYHMQDDRSEWNLRASAVIPNDAEQIGPKEGGVFKPLTGEDVNLIMARMTEILAVLEGQWKADVIYKGCVRELEVR